MTLLKKTSIYDDNQDNQDDDEVRERIEYVSKVIMKKIVHDFVLSTLVI